MARVMMSCITGLGGAKVAGVAGVATAGGSPTSGGPTMGPEAAAVFGSEDCRAAEPNGLVTALGPAGCARCWMACMIMDGAASRVR